MRREAVQRQIHFDELDRLVAWNLFGDENVHLALHGIVQHQPLARQHLIEVQDICHIAVRILQSHQVRLRRTIPCPWGRGRGGRWSGSKPGRSLAEPGHTQREQ